MREKLGQDGKGTDIHYLKNVILKLYETGAATLVAHVSMITWLQDPAGRSAMPLQHCHQSSCVVHMHVDKQAADCSACRTDRNHQSGFCPYRSGNACIGPVRRQALAAACDTFVTRACTGGFAKGRGYPSSRCMRPTGPC